MPNRVNSQGYLFPKTCRELAESIGLDWWAAKKLYDDKWLSFDPDRTTMDNASLEAEFRFLGSLVSSGCDPHIMKRLLEGLEKPYCYDLSRIYYDWPSRKWKDFPQERDPREIVAELISALEEDSNSEGLNEIGEQVRDALTRLGEGKDEDFEDDSSDGK